MKTRLTPHLQKEIVRYLSLGYTHETACNLIGIKLDQLYQWIDKGKNDKTGIYRSFLSEIEKVERKAKKRKERKMSLPLDFYKKNGLKKPT